MQTCKNKSIKLNLLKFCSLIFFVFTVLAPSSILAQKKPVILCTTGMIADLAKQIAGDRAQIVQLISSGVDPHLYKLTRSDVSSLSNSDIIFYNGLLLEGKMTDALIRLARSGKTVVAVTEKIDENYLLQPEEFAGHFDPHVWMDPIAWSKAAEVIYENLSKLDPNSNEFYLNNKNILIQNLEELDNYSKKILSLVPRESRILLTAHDAFNYFGKRYGFEVLGIQGISTESEAGVKDIQKLVDLIVEKKIKSVFIESTVSDRNITALIEGAKAKNHDVSLGGSLFSDAMGKDGTYEGTYLGMIDHNVTTIAKALADCTDKQEPKIECVPAKGMNSKLM